MTGAAVPFVLFCLVLGVAAQWSDEVWTRISGVALVAFVVWAISANTLQTGPNCIYCT